MWVPVAENVPLFMHSALVVMRVPDAEIVPLLMHSALVVMSSSLLAFFVGPLSVLGCGQLCPLAGAGFAIRACASQQ